MKCINLKRAFTEFWQMHTPVWPIPLSCYRTLTSSPESYVTFPVNFSLTPIKGILCSLFWFFPPHNHFACFSILYKWHHITRTVLCETFTRYTVSEINPCCISLVAESYFIVWIYQRLFIHYLNDTHLISFQFLDSCNGHFITSLFVILCFHLLNKHLGMEFLGHREGVCFHMTHKSCHSFPKMVMPFYISINYVWEFQLFHTSSIFDVVSFLIFSLSDCIVVFHCAFNLHFTDN